jgi:hypothetical protein
MHLAGIGLSGFGNPREYRAIVNPGNKYHPFGTNSEIVHTAGGKRNRA